MSYGRLGFAAMTDRALGSPKDINFGNKQNGQILLRVVDIILDENHPKYQPLKGLSQIGAIEGNEVNPDGTIIPTIINAIPSPGSSMKYPTVNEYVKAWRTVSPNEPSGMWVYGETVSVWGMLAPNVSPFPVNTTNLNPPSQNLSYTQIEAGAYNIQNTQNQEISFNSPNAPSQATFVEKENIHPLMPFMGDIIYEGRWGNSIRLGSTTKSKSIYRNNWSNAGDNGDPITIIRNGQPQNAKDFGAEPITENVNNDLSSIYLTSYQQLANFSIANENFNSFSTAPISPSSYAFPQIALNSNRVVINAKSDSVLISGQKSIGLTSHESINLESPQIILEGSDVRLGSKIASQPILKGNDTVKILKQMTRILQGISQILEVSQVYPSGVPVPDTAALIISGQANDALGLILKVLEDEKNGIKSNFVKTL
jgi:hypothetical protein